MHMCAFCFNRFLSSPENSQHSPALIFIPNYMWKKSSVTSFIRAGSAYSPLMGVFWVWGDFEPNGCIEDSQGHGVLGRFSVYHGSTAREAGGRYWECCTLLSCWEPELLWKLTVVGGTCNPCVCGAETGVSWWIWGHLGCITSTGPARATEGKHISTYQLWAKK